MPVESNKKNEGDAGGGPSATRREDRSRMVRFVVLFIVYVLTLLLGYQYAINTEVNMRYLFIVATHTTATLSLFGEESGLESDGRPRAHAKRGRVAAAKRTELNEWRSRDADSADGENDAALTPWEEWLHRAYHEIHEGRSLQDQGPLVHFTAKTGLNSKISLLHVRINDARTDEAQLEGLKTELKILEQEREELRKDDESGRVGRDKAFSFRVVPDCGAIPSMSIFLAAVLAFPTPWWKRVAGLAAGLPFF